MSIQSATVCFVEVTDKLADCRSEQLRSGVKIRPRTNQRLFLQTITIVNKSAQTMFNISFYNFNWHLIIWRAKVGLNLCRFYTLGLPKCLFFFAKHFWNYKFVKSCILFLITETKPSFSALVSFRNTNRGLLAKTYEHFKPLMSGKFHLQAFVCEKIMFRNICCFYIFKHRKVI